MATIADFARESRQARRRRRGGDRTMVIGVIAAFLVGAFAATDHGGRALDHGVTYVRSFPVPGQPVDRDATTAAVAPARAVRLSVCGGEAGTDCVVDGDTIRLSGEKIRIADIDTPEIFSPRCEAERARGEAAKYRLVALINAGPFEVHRGVRDEDRYGRKLRTLHRDGRSLGDILVAEGLARHWDGARRGWCA